jgi:micrococcal nuclease
VNLELVRSGMATSYEFEPNTKHTSEFDTAETQARNAKLGIWAPSSFTITISQMVYDAPGNDNDNLNGEFITFSNEGNTTVDMTGWLVLDESNNDYFFPTFSLGNSSSVTLFMGSGTDSISELYWGSSKSIWNNDGDELFLRDSQGLLVAYYRY